MLQASDFLVLRVELHMQRLRVKFSSVEIIAHQGGSDDYLLSSGFRVEVSQTRLFMTVAIRQIMYTLDRYFVLIT